MCGIVGMFSPGGRVSSESLRRATSSLHHRGPDGQRTWIADHGRVGLGHARLSIIDLATGDQPIASEDERLHIVVNGEFYDYERIQKELEARGHRLRTRSDSEIALHLYEDLGAACLRAAARRVRASCSGTSANQVLFAARDRFGIKPLFYAFHDGDALPRLRGQGALRGGRAGALGPRDDLSRDERRRPSFADALRRASSRCRPVTICWRRAGTRSSSATGTSTIRARTSETPATRTKSTRSGCTRVLDEAVRLRLRADVPVGCYLSGGLDSCAVLGLASKHLSTPDPGVHAHLRPADYDESAIAEEMAREAGAEYYPVPIRQDDLADHFADAIWHAETLCFNAHGVAKYLLTRAVRDAGYKVVLTGEGSDEIFGGYAHFRRDMLLYDNGGQDPQTVRRPARAARTQQSRLARAPPAGRRDDPDRRRCAGSWASRRPGSKRPAGNRFKLRAMLSRRLRRGVRRTRRLSRRFSTAWTCRGGSRAGRPCTSRSTSGARRSSRPTSS